MSPLLRVRNLSKSFPGVRALDNVRLDVEPGEVHAVVGENGAGKSTLMNVLGGVHRPDDGQILFKGNAAKLHSPHDARKLGISMIHQELMPFRDLTVAENIFMGREPVTRFPGWIDKRGMRREAADLLARLAVSLPPTRAMRELSVAEMQTVEIAKALAHASDVIIMDEPTSAISDREVDRLFDVIADLKGRGVAVIYISHKLEEVFRIADRVTVLRDGRYVSTDDVADLDTGKLIARMVGRELRDVFPESSAPKGNVALSVRGLTRKGRFREIGFDVRQGEILGIAGLMGAGRTDLVSAIYGLAPADSGGIAVKGKRVRIAKPRDALANGIAMVTEDRKQFGLVPKMSVKHNVTLSTLKRYCRGSFISGAHEARAADDSIRAFSIKTPDRDRTVDRLSGGNQQKVLLARSVLTEPDVLILDEPTRGIDINAKAEVYGAIVRLAAEGKAIVLVSSELPEILMLSDRILVMREGTLTAELDARQATQEMVMRFAVPK